MSYGILLLVLSLSTLVLGDTRHKFLMSRLVFENKECDTFGEWSGRYEDNKGSTSKMFVDFSIKKPISEGTMVHMKMEFPGQEPFEKDIDFLDALEDKNFGESFVKSVKPEGLGSGAPIPEGSYSSTKWIPSMNPVPAGTEGKARITASIGSCVTIVCEGTIRY